MVLNEFELRARENVGRRVMLLFERPWPCASALILFLMASHAAVAEPLAVTPAMAPATVGDVVLEFDGSKATKKLLSRAVSERRTVKAIEELDGKRGLLFRPGAPGTYFVSVSGQGSQLRGTLVVSVSIQTPGGSGTLVAHGSSSESWPRPPERSPFEPSPFYPQIYPRVKSGTDKNGRPIVKRGRDRSGETEQWERIARAQHRGGASQAFAIALDLARQQAEDELQTLRARPASINK